MVRSWYATANHSVSTVQVIVYGFEWNLEKTCTSDFFKDDQKEECARQVQFEVFEKLTSVCFSKLREKPHYHLLII